MTIAFWCVFVACLLPVLTAWLSSWYRYQQFGAIDNKHPRTQSAAMEGAGARAVAAQQNAWEALPVFVAAVVVAYLAGLDQTKADIAGVIFIVARLLYPVFYICNLDILRSLSFIVGFFSCVSLFVMAA